MVWMKTFKEDPSKTVLDIISTPYLLHDRLWDELGNRSVLKIHDLLKMHWPTTLEKELQIAFRNSL